MSLWYFEERDRRAVLTFPKNEEHFAAVSGIVASLVREITQNSGDAGAGSEPVQVQFRFGKLEANRFADHIEGLPAHLQTFPDLRIVLETSKTVHTSLSKISVPPVSRDLTTSAPMAPTAITSRFGGDTGNLIKPTSMAAAMD